MNTTKHFRHTVIEAGRADEPATRGRRNSAPVSYQDPMAALSRFLLVCAVALEIGTVVLYLVTKIAGAA